MTNTEDNLIASAKLEERIQVLRELIVWTAQQKAEAEKCYEELQEKLSEKRED